MLSGYASLVSGDYETSKQSASLIPNNLQMHIVQLYIPATTFSEAQYVDVDLY